MSYLSKIFNKKVSNRVLGKKGHYSFSLIGCKLDWYEIPVLKKIASKNYPTLDNLIGLPSSHEQTKSDTILRVFVNPMTDDIKSALSLPISSLYDSNFDKLVIQQVFMSVLGELKLEGGKYEITNIDDISVGESQINAIKITGETNDDLKSTKCSENIFIPMNNFLLVFNLVLFDKDEPKRDIIEEDFKSILSSIKL